MATTTRNLHHDGIRFDTPWFLELLAELGFELDVATDERVIRRFIMGQNTAHLDAKERSRVHDTISIEIGDCETSNVDDFFGNMRAQLVEPLAARGISTEDVTRISLWEGNYEVSYNRLQNDAEFEARRRFTHIANMLEALRPQIYNRVDAAIAAHSSHPQS